MREAREETVAWRYFSRDVLPFAAMFTVECTTVGASTLYKAASSRGLSFYVFVFYSYLVSTLVLLPLSLIFGRFMSHIASCKGIEYSSPTLASAISNLTPAFTFTLAVIFSALTHTWGLHLKGPVYVSLFRPLSIAIAVAMGAIFLGDALHLGSVIGSMILCFGF
ncbi:unnamed protein product [Brassica napus]|uniref:(rape) hypothetical protein n=1 Tax=Brassica napus TaxID=3708 RepID=A0A816JTB4_BRANA|nr:unnamed protein product [Brassica napus]